MNSFHIPSPYTHTHTQTHTHKYKLVTCASCQCKHPEMGKNTLKNNVILLKIKYYFLSKYIIKYKILV